MSTYRKFFPHLVTLLFAFGLPLVSAGQALAQTPCNDATPPINFIVKPNHPTTGDAQLIFHLFASYSWALDDRRDQDFVDLFTAKAIYEVCRNGGAQPQSQIVRTTDNAELQKFIATQFVDLENDRLQTRHFLSNIVLNAQKENVVDAKSTMAVTIQVANQETPDLDYTAVLKAVIVKEGDVWKFSQLTIFTDTPTGIARAR